MDKFLYTVTVKDNSLWDMKAERELYIHSDGIKEILAYIKEHTSEEDYTFQIEVPASIKYVAPLKLAKKMPEPKKKRKRNIIKDDSADVI